MSERVWLVESGDYSQRGVDLVAASVESAIAAIKARYPEPYQVTWDEPTNGDRWRGEEVWMLTGHFEHVQHYSTKHSCTYEIAPWEVESLTPAVPPC